MNHSAFKKWQKKAGIYGELFLMHKSKSYGRINERKMIEKNQNLADFKSPNKCK